MSASKRRILFVDDEPKILAGLRRTLRCFRREWEMQFVAGAGDALDRLAACPFDVIVTDMRMPRMDGAQLLGVVRKRYPGTMRIILSGQCDQQAILRCVGPAHQFFTKPCDLETLKSAVAAACVLRDGLACPRHTGMVSRLESLPSRPWIYAALVAELESAQASLERLAAMIAQDVAMAAKTLHLVASGFFGAPQRVSDLGEAVNFLGLKTIKSLGGCTNAFFPLEADDAEPCWLERLTDHCQAVATAAKAIAEAETNDPLLVGEAFLAGLLHHVGTLVLAQYPLDESCRRWGASGLEHPQFREAEGGSLRAGHPDVGAYLMALWGLPAPIVEAIAHHQSPRRSSNPAFAPLTAVHVAHAVLEEESRDISGPPHLMDMDYLGQLGLSGRVDRWRETCRAGLAQGVPASNSPGRRSRQNPVTFTRESTSGTAGAIRPCRGANACPEPRESSPRQRVELKATGPNGMSKGRTNHTRDHGTDRPPRDRGEAYR